MISVWFVGEIGICGFCCVFSQVSMVKSVRFSSRWMVMMMGCSFMVMVQVLKVFCRQMKFSSVVGNQGWNCSLVLFDLIQCCQVVIISMMMRKFMVMVKQWWIILIQVLVQVIGLNGMVFCVVLMCLCVSSGLVWLQQFGQLGQLRFELVRCVKVLNMIRLKVKNRVIYISLWYLLVMFCVCYISVRGIRVIMSLVRFSCISVVVFILS